MMLPTSVRKSLLNSIYWSNVGIQNVNIEDTESLYKKSKAEFCDILFKNNVLNERYKNRVGEIVPMILNDNVDLHNDSYFASFKGYMSRTCLIMLDEGYKKDKPDSPMTTWFFHSNKLFPVSSGQVVWFNSAKEHAFFPKAKVKLLSIWITND